MGLSTMTRRTFMKLAAVSSVAATISLSSNSGHALAETDRVQDKSSVQRIRTACRGCGKMECGVWVTVENGRAIRIEGDETAFQSNGNCCTKSMASIQAAYHPDRIMYPMKRTGPKGEDPGWVRISWEEANQIVHEQLTQLKEKYGGETCMHMTGTSRFWAMGASRIGNLIGAINAHGANAICKGPRREAGSLTIENGIFFNSTIDKPLVYVQWGTEQTQSNYDDSCRTVVAAAKNAQKYISIDPRKTNLGKEADYHLALRPGTDGALALAWTRIVMERELYDDLLVKRWSNAPFLYCEEIERTGWETAKYNTSAFFELKTRLLKESDILEGGSISRFMVWDNENDRLTWFDADEAIGMWEGQTEHDIQTSGWENETGGWIPDPVPFPVDIDPALWGEFEVTLKDGKTASVKPVFQKYWDDVVSEWTLEKAAETCDLDPNLIEEACMAWATRLDERRGNGGLNIQLAPEQTSRAIQNFRAAYLLFFMTDNYDTPGGNRGMTRAPINAGGPNTTMPAKPKSVSNWAQREKICGAEEFPLMRWWSAWVDATSIWEAALEDKPYPIRGCICEGGDFMNQSNSLYAWEALKQMEFTMTIDMWHCPQAEISDLLLPCQHWLEIPGFCRISQGAHGAFGANINCIEPLGETKYDPQISVDLYKVFGVPFYNPEDGGDPWDRPITAWLDYNVKDTGMTWEEYATKFQENGWFDAKKEYPERWGTYRRYQMGYLRQPDGMSLRPGDGMPGMPTPTMKAEIWSTIMETYLDPDEPTNKNSRVKDLTASEICFPKFFEPEQSPVSTPGLFEEYPFNMTTGRRIPVYFHNEHRQLPWCREQWPVPRMEIHPDDAEHLGIKQGDWVWIENRFGKVRQVADLSYGIKPGVINAEHQWWFPESTSPTKGFELCGINCLVDKDAQDPFCGSTQLRAYPVKVYKATPDNCPDGKVIPTDTTGVEIISTSTDPRLKEWLPDYGERG